MRLPVTVISKRYFTHTSAAPYHVPCFVISKQGTKERGSSMSIDRRDFIKGAAVVAGASLAMGNLAACSAGKAQDNGMDEANVIQVQEGQSTAADASTYNVPGMATENVAGWTGTTSNVELPKPIEPPASWDHEADVVVCGTGGGLYGATRAAHLGNSVIALEAAGTYGGTSKEACVFAFTSGTKCQIEAELPDVSETLRQSFYEGAPQGSRYATFIDSVMKGQQDMVAWTEELGFEWEPGEVVGDEKVYAIAPKGSEEDMNSARMMTYVINWLAEQFESMGGQFLFNTTVTGLIMENDRVVGVQATSQDGEVVNVKANKGVLLSMGGMCNNIELMKRYNPEAYLSNMVSNGGTKDNGDGIRLALGAGAAFEGFNRYGAFDGGVEHVEWNTHLYRSVIQIARQPWLGIDTNGDRYPYQITALKGYTAQGAMYRKMPGCKAYVFFDSNYEEYAPTFKQLMCRYLTNPDMADVQRLEGVAETDWRQGVKEAIEKGQIQQADTFEELAEKLTLDPQKVTNAVKNWNDMCKAGEDPEYNYDPSWLFPLSKPPYYGMAVGSMLYSTYSGPAVNEHMQVLDTQQNPIEGLYATGQDAGRMVSVAGSCCFAATSAYMAVNHINGLSE